MSKKIGLVGWKLGDNSFGATIPYLEFFSLFGDVHILPPTKELTKDLDLIVLPGGQDTYSHRYNATPSYFNSNPDQFKEFFFDNNLKAYIDLGVPVFGVCLGHQMLQVLFGGTLVQNCGHVMSEKSRDQLVHELELLSPYKNLRYDLDLGKKFEVNSLHHQGIALEELSPVFEPIAICKDDSLNIVEVMKHVTLPIASVQYHCEELYDPLSIHLVGQLMQTVDEELEVEEPNEKLEK